MSAYEPEKINIVHTVLSLEMGGMEKVVTDIVLGLDAERYRVEVCSFDNPGHFSSCLEARGINVTFLQRNQARYDAFLPFRLKKLLQDKKTDVLHMHNGTFFFGTQAALLAGIGGRIYTDHGRLLDDKKIHVAMDKFGGFFVKKIIPVSHELENYLVETVGLPAAKMTTIINGTDTGLFTPRPKAPALLAELQIPPSHRIIGTVGRLAEVKDQVSMIKAFAKVCEEIADITLLIIGDGPLLSVLRQTAEDCNVAGNVVFAGKRSDIPMLMNLIDIFMLTSLSEGTSISLLEAMASGVTPVVTAVGGNPAIVRHGINGIVVSPGDVTAMAGAVTSLLNNDKLRDKYSANAMESVRRDYGLERMIDKYSAVYDEVCRC